MDWKRIATDDLKKYMQYQTATINIQEKIKMLEEQLDGLKSSGECVPVKGGMSSYEDRLIDNIVKRDRLKLNLRIIRYHMSCIERGLQNLTHEERTILHYFYIDRPSHPIDIIRDKLYLEQSRIYQIKDTALYKFTVSMYGIVDL